MVSGRGWTFISAACLLPSMAMAQWSDNFDSYAAGSNVIGQGGWKGWNNSPTNGSLVVNTQSLSAPNSLQNVGIGDTVRQFSGVNSGQWRFTANVFVPTNFTVTGEVAWFILLSDYADNSTTDHWSTQVEMTAAGQVTDGSTNGGTVTPTTLIRGQWVPITVDFNLDTNTRIVKYNGIQISNGTWTDGSAGATRNLGAVDLFANSPDDVTGGNTIPVFYDNLSLAPVPEPATIAGLALGVVAFLRKRRK